MSSSNLPDYGSTRASPTGRGSPTADAANSPPISIPAASVVPAINEAHSDALDDPPPGGFKKDLGFWIIVVCLGLCIWLAALDLTAVATALPTIVSDLPGATSFVWIGSAFTLASTAVLPLSGNLAQIFGRQATLEGFIVLFAIGSAVTGAARTMTMAIAGRTVQGLGGGGIIALADIIIADLVPLRERGMYEAILAVVWAVASAVGPPIGGALAQSGNWRWLFWMNLPACAGSAGLVWWFLKLKRPAGSWRRKLKRVDWIGNAIVIGAATSTVIALVEGGIDHPWDSYQIVVPLVIGLIGIVVFLVYEAFFAVGERMVPLSLLTNRTTLSGFAGTFVHGLVSLLFVYYAPVYFQSAMLASPVRSSVQSLPGAFTIAPCAILTGVAVTVTGHYVAPNIGAWMISIVGFGLMSTLTKSSSTAEWVLYQMLTSVGMGILWIGVEFPILAPLPSSKNAHALAFLNFLRTAANTFGVTIGAAVLQNELHRTLPAAFSERLPEGIDIAYAAIPQIPSLPQPLQDEVRDAFAASLSTLWKVTAGLCGLGLLTSLGMKQLSLNAHVDEDWGREEKKDETVPLAATNHEQEGA
ncbi:MFS general substrate transporter [Calocera viscosa TUFC12733]|uniref:MFS general substrate transporter n=1 Tax=Calocera viscosa (strain TUFC12733) TaxID=1330018 RepID=A0A167KHE5_CALVF|nr:MFS general substrate transporter [Calocera viscosa TUFC12733]